MIIGPLYQRGEGMDRRKTGTGRLLPSTVFFEAPLLLLFLLLLSWSQGFAASLPFQVLYPKSPLSGDPLKIHVLFPTPPPPQVFYQLEVTVDGQPVAMADLSEERTTWVTAPPLKEGLHHIAVIWKNPPGGSPITSRQDLSILPKGEAPSEVGTH